MFMVPHLPPGVYISEIEVGPTSIEGVGTNTAAFLGQTQKGPVEPQLVTSWAEYQNLFGGTFGIGKFLPYAVAGFFENGGKRCYIARVVSSAVTVSETKNSNPTVLQLQAVGKAQAAQKMPVNLPKTPAAQPEPVLSDYVAALARLEAIDGISIINAPYVASVPTLSNEVVNHCEKFKTRFAVLDAPPATPNPTPPKTTQYAAFYWPWINVADPALGQLVLVPPGGYIAGIYARNDAERGVHKAPANIEVRGAHSLEYNVSTSQQDLLNPKGVNCLREFSGRGLLVWGARTLSSDPLWKYVNVRRLFIYLEESIQRGTQWAVFEPNTPALWARLTQTVSQFLTQAWKTGALMGNTPEEAFFVKCDRTTMTQDDINNGRIILMVGAAPTKPAEFVIFRVAQWQGGSAATD
jgi:phage tail sheath protein FI